MPNKYDFAAWLDTKNPDQTYNFHDGCGNCLMGQYMAAQGEHWDFGRYNEYIEMVLGKDNVSILSSQPQSMGEARKRVQKLFEDA